MRAVIFIAVATCCIASAYAAAPNSLTTPDPSFIVRSFCHPDFIDYTKVCRTCNDYCPCESDTRKPYLRAAPNSLTTPDPTFIVRSFCHPDFIDYTKVCRTCNDYCLCESDTRQPYPGGIKQAGVCSTNQNCPKDKVCVEGQCINPCGTLCGTNAECQVIDHVPACVCKAGFTGNAYTGCEQQKGCNISLLPTLPAGTPAKRFVLHTAFKANWYSAFRHCLKNNGRLARIENEEQQREIEQLLESSNVGDDNFFIGGTDLAQEGKWTWDLTGPELGDYRKWHRRQPDNFHHDEHCMAITSWNTAHHFWNDEKCCLHEYFICEH